MTGLLALLCVTGCSGFGRGATGPRTQSDRLMAAYPELATGRFWVMADFEQIDHHQLFHVESHSGAAICIPSNSAGVPETGKKCLRVILADPLDALVVSNARAANWSLRRDWRNFHLLVGAIHSPVDNLELNTTITAGPSRGSVAVQSLTRLQRGWNVLRLDLGEAAERIAIDDVRELRFTLPKAEAPTELVVDDLVLADNREELFGSPDDSAEGLYVQRQGRRLNVGAAGRFELGLANGQIIHWFDLGSDPHRLRNLVGGGVLGPYPVILSGGGLQAGWTPSTDFSALGDTVIAHQQVIEANPVRIILACTLRYTLGGRKPDRDSPFQQWTYTVLRTGQVYVRFECTTHFGDWMPASMALVASRADHGPLQVFAHPTAGGSDAHRPPHAAYALAHPAATDRPGLLMVVHPAKRVPTMAVANRQDPRRVDLLASTTELERPTQTWSCLLVIWPPGITEPTAARTQALDYCQPASPDVRVGRLVTDSPGDDNRDGFNERFGCCVLQPEGDLVRMVIDGTDQPRVCPVFSVPGTADRQAWVYVNNVILQPVARDAAGDILFQLPLTVGGQTLVEVVLRTRHAAPAS